MFYTGGTIPVVVLLRDLTHKLQQNMGKRNREALAAQKNLFNVLKCPCCWTFVGVYFEQCINSHTVCSRCKQYIPNCPICRRQFIGRPVLLSAIIEQLIQVFSGLSSGDKAVDDYLKHQGLTPSSTQAPSDPATPQKVGAATQPTTESPVYNAALASRAVEVFLQQQALMMRPSSRTQDSSS